MNEVEYMDFLCRCEEFEERNNDCWMDDGWEDDYGDGAETYT